MSYIAPWMTGGHFPPHMLSPTHTIHPHHHLPTSDPQLYESLSPKNLTSPHQPDKPREQLPQHSPVSNNNISNSHHTPDHKTSQASPPATVSSSDATNPYDVQGFEKDTSQVSSPSVHKFSEARDGLPPQLQVLPDVNYGLPGTSADVKAHRKYMRR